MPDRSLEKAYLKFDLKEEIDPRYLPNHRRSEWERKTSAFAVAAFWAAASNSRQAHILYRRQSNNQPKSDAAVIYMNPRSLYAAGCPKRAENMVKDSYFSA